MQKGRGASLAGHASGMAAAPKACPVACKEACLEISQVLSLNAGEVHL